MHLRIERKGRKGKTVTVLGGLGALFSSERKALAKNIGKALGCGSTVEGDEVVVQGDQRDRLAAWLEREKSTEQK
jgi:translation initiation factor 1